jgi:hypothetical protein
MTVKGIAKPKQFDVLAARRAVAIDLKHPDGIACVLDILRVCPTDRPKDSGQE